MSAINISDKLDIIAKKAYSFKETVYHTYNTAHNLIIEGIYGDFVECGVAAGSQIGAMQLANEYFRSSRIPKKIIGFDSFEGIPLAGPEDAEQPGIGKITHAQNVPEAERLVSSGITVHSKESVLSNFKQWGLPTDNLHLVKGWFQDTLPQNNTIKEIALLRLDGDLYESTMVCLEHLYPLVVKGGVVIIDDYELHGCQKSVHNYLNTNGIKVDLMEVPNSGGVRYFYKL